MPESFRCSDAARERQDPRLGTAPPQRRLLLVEQESGWGTEAIASLAAPDDVREEIRRRTGAAGTRVMLIRRPGRQESPVCRLRAWCVVDPYAVPQDRLTWGTWAYPADLLAAVERAEELERDARATPEQPADHPGEDSPERAGRHTPVLTGPDEEGLLLVCTNGRKDVCCAVRGRPVAEALARRWPEQTWECTHTGGDRFAANLLVLPDGAAYGGLDTGSAVRVVQEHRDGHSDATHLRGMLGLPRPVQAAVAGAMGELGLPWGQVRPAGRPVQVEAVDEPEVTRRAAELAAEATTVARWRIPVVAGGTALEAEVSEHLRPAAALTCKAVDAPAHSRVPVLDRLRAAPTIGG